MLKDEQMQMESRLEGNYQVVKLMFIQERWFNCMEYAQMLTSLTPPDCLNALLMPPNGEESFCNTLDAKALNTTRTIT